MLLKELTNLDVGCYRMVRYFRLPFTNIKLFKTTQGYINVLSKRHYLTTTGQHIHTRLEAFPCISFKLSESGYRVGGLNKNFCGWMQTIVMQEYQEKYFEDFMGFFRETDVLEFVGE